MFPPPVEPKKDFICDVCGSRMKTKHSLRNHLLVHNDTKSHACTICGKKFRQNSDRKIHERQHTGEVKETLNVRSVTVYRDHFSLVQCRNPSYVTSVVKDSLVKDCLPLIKGFTMIPNIRVQFAEKNSICSQPTGNTSKRTIRIVLSSAQFVQKHSPLGSTCQNTWPFTQANRFCEFNTSDGLRQHQRHKHKFAS